MSILNGTLLFIHINKSGGGYITESFKNSGRTYCTGYHRTLSGMLDAAQKAGVDTTKLLSFTIVRNPWARMVSMYEFYRQHKKWCIEFGIYDYNRRSYRSFPDWIKYIYSDKFPRKNMHSKINVYYHCFCNQVDWLDDDHDVKIFKLEDMVEINSFLIQNDVKPINVKIHSTTHPHYREYYDDETREAVARHYSKDISSFGYEF